MTKTYNDYEEWIQPYLGISEKAKPKKDGKLRNIIVIKKEIPFKEAFKNKLKKNCKAVISGNCVVCNKEFKMNWNKLVLRKFSGDKEICQKCSLKFATNTDEWREKNSKAQLIAQNKPEVLKKMSDSVKKSKTEDVKKRTSETMKKVWKTDKYIKNQKQKHLEGMQKAYNNPESLYKMIHKNRFYTGWYESKWGDIFFASSWELAYIIYCENNENIIHLEKCMDWIKYKDSSGKTRKYNPDFKIKTIYGEYVIEIKGKLAYNNKENYVFLKADASKRFYKNTVYCLYLITDLIRMGVLSSNHKAKKFCDLHNDKIKNLNKGGRFNGKC